MDRVVKVRRSFLNDIRAFLNVFAQMCVGCYRTPCSCSLSDEIARAKSLIVRIDNARDAEEERFYVANPFEDLLDRIEKAVLQARGRPVRSDEIRISGVSRQKKARGIKVLVRRGRLEVSIERGQKVYIVSGTR